jgi:hypothetical protein
MIPGHGQRAHGGTVASWRARAWFAGVLVLVGATSGAAGQISFEARTRFALGWGDGATPITEPILITQPGRIDLTFQMGIFNAQGYDNYGVGFWSGTIFSSEPGLSRPASPRVAPFNTSFGFDGNINAEGTRIGLPGQRQIEPTRSETVYFYNEGDPVPGLPPRVGNDQYADLYRFSIMIADVATPRDILIRATGVNWPIEGFYLFQQVPPDPETGAPGYVWWSPNPAGDGPAPAQPAQASLATLRLVPSPGTGAFLTLAGVLILRRRR